MQLFFNKNSTFKFSKDAEITQYTQKILPKSTFQDQDGQQKLILCTGTRCVEVTGDSYLLFYFMALNAICLLAVTIIGVRKVCKTLFSVCQGIFNSLPSAEGDNPSRGNNMPMLPPPTCQCPSCPPRL